MLPRPNRPFGFAPYYAYWQGIDDWATVAEFANEFYCWPSRMFAGTSAAVWIKRAGLAMNRAALDGKKIHLNLDILNPDANVSLVLASVSQCWGSVSRIEAADEPKWTGNGAATAINQLRAQIKLAGLDPRPIGAVYSQKQFPGKAPTNALDWIGVEAYVDPPGGSLSENSAALKAYLLPAMANVPPGKKIVVVGQSYARNGAWQRPPSLGPLLKETYRLSVANPRVIALNCFSWLRESGAAQYPVVAQAVRTCGKACL